MDKKIELLEYLIGLSEFKSATSLGKTVGVSSKTILRYIKSLNDILVKYGYSIESKQGFGYGFNINEEEKYQLKKIIDEEILPAIKIDEDFSLVFRNLLSSKKYTVIELSQECYMSESALRKQLENLRAYLKIYGLELVEDRDGFLIILGDNYQKIQCIVNYLNGLPRSKSKKYLPKILENEDLRVKEVIVRSFANMEDGISDFDLEFLSDIILTCTNEIRAGRTCNNRSEKLSNKYEKFLSQLTDKLNLDSFYSYSEIIVEWLDSIVTTEFDEYEKLKSDVIDLLSNFDNSITSNLIANDDLINQLVKHMIKFIDRSKKGIHIENPLSNDIKRGFPLEFSIAYYLCKEIGVKYGAKLNENEIGFIAVYLATQKELMKSDQLSVAIICHYGIGTANLLKERIINNYPDFHILGIFPFALRESAYKLNPDLVISSIELKDCNTEYVFIKDIFGDELNKSLSRKYVSKKEINSFLNLLSPANMLSLSAENSKDAIRKIGEKLNTNDCIEEQIIYEVLERESISSTDVGNLVAVPHVISSKQSESIIAVCKLDKPIKWGKEFVSLIFFIVFSEGDTENLRAFKVLYNFIENINNVENLLSNFSYMDFVKIITDI